MGSTISVTAVGNLRSATPSRERAMAVPNAQATRVACFDCNATSARSVFLVIDGCANIGVGVFGSLGWGWCGAAWGRVWRPGREGCVKCGTRLFGQGEEEAKDKEGKKKEKRTKKKEKKGAKKKKETKGEKKGRKSKNTKQKKDEKTKKKKKFPDV